MSSNIRILKICEMCSKEFIAKKATSKTCSDNCAKRFYKLKIKNEKITKVEMETAIKKAPTDFVTEEKLRVINVKEYLTLKEVALLINFINQVVVDLENSRQVNFYNLQGKSFSNSLKAELTIEQIIFCF